MAAWLAVLALSSAPVAADTYCVAPASGCDSAHTKTTITAALSAATGNPGADTIELGAATYSENDLAYTGTGPLTVAGAGPAATTIQHQGAYTEPVLQLNSSAAVNLSAVRIHVRSDESVNGIWARNSGGGTLDNLVIDGGSELNNLGHGIRFLYANGWTLSRSTIDLTTQSACVSLLGSAGVRLEDDVLTGCLTGLVSEGASSFDVRRVRISATPMIGDTSFGVIVRGGNGRVDDSLLAGNTSGAALLPASASASLTLNHDTIVGEGELSVQGVRCGTSGGTGVLTLADSIVRGFQNDVDRRGDAGFPCDINADYNDYAVSTVYQSGSGSLNSTHVQDDVDPQFVDAPAGNFRLGTGSPLLDLDGRALDLAESPTDLDGLPRIAGGARDLGAYERPAMSATTGAATGVTETGAGLAGNIAAGGLPGTWRFVYGTSTSYGSATGETPVTGSSVTATLTELTPATTYHYKLILTTAYGNISGLDGSFTTLPAGQIVGPSALPGVVPGTTMPTPPAKPLARLRLTGKLRFKAGAVKMPVRCEATGPQCRVTATVRHTAKVGRRKVTRVIGTKRYALAAGRRETMSIKLNRTGRKLLKRLHSLKARVTVELIQADGSRTRTFEKVVRLGL